MPEKQNAEKAVHGLQFCVERNLLAQFIELPAVCNSKVVLGTESVNYVRNLERLGCGNAEEGSPGLPGPLARCHLHPQQSLARGQCTDLSEFARSCGIFPHPLLHLRKLERAEAEAA